MRAIRRFVVQPALPAPLTPLVDLAQNLRWSWHEDSQDLFRSIDPNLWSQLHHDPIALLSAVSPERLTHLAQDRTFVREVARVRSDLDDYLHQDRWYQAFRTTHPQAPRAIGYFSAEFGISSVLPQYSGGLGILAGDHLKSASDLGAPVIGVGLLYRHGYFRQSVDAKGWQHESYPVLDPHELPVELLRTPGGEPVLGQVEVRGRGVHFHIWVAQVGRVPLLMLDTHLESNAEPERMITDKLYGGGSDHRLAQEVLLGIGGVRALRAFCSITGHPEPDVYHANEGHAGFLGLERMRESMLAGDDFDTALSRVRAGTVFTTHTPVSAGIDRFPVDLVAEQFRHFAPLPLDRVLALGRETIAGGDQSRFNMAIMGLRLAQRANGVSRLHGEVSRELFGDLWPDFDTSEVPIGSVTNGVHHTTWLHPDLLRELEVSTGDSESVIDGCDWTALDRLDDNAIWTMKRQMRGDMIAMARQRLAQSCQRRGINAEWVATALDPHTLTIGFARRAASYKRLTLMLRQPERLKALLNDPSHPIQIVIAGKAHPADDTGKGLIQQVIQFADQEDVRHRFVFLPDYDISMAQPLYPGCDVWLNNPLRPYEACGTSGMKAALNGAANLSVRDGWWDEWYDPAWGWEIPSAEGTEDFAARDAAEAESLYEVIENQIVPRFYDRDASKLPRRWIEMIRAIISGLGPKVLATRMVRDYVTELYTPAAQANAAINVPGAAEELASYRSRVTAAWPRVRILTVEAEIDSPIEVGGEGDFHAMVDLAGLSTADVCVELVVGEVDADDQLHQVRTYQMSSQTTGTSATAVRFDRVLTKNRPGTIGFTVRVVPRHRLLSNPAELGLATVASDPVA